MKQNWIIFPILLAFTLAPSVHAQEDHKPVVAVVLAGGGALGFAHVGALQVLEEEGIHPDFIVGASMGSIVGGLYSTGYSAVEIERLIRETDWKDTMLDSYDRTKMSYEKRLNQSTYTIRLGSTDENRVSDAGLSQAQHVVELLDRLLAPYTTEMDFDDLPIPFRAVGADLLTGDKVVMGDGDLKMAIRASMAVPGVFTPVEFQDRYIIDGGWAENLPTTVAREMGADIVIAVSLFSLEDDIEKLNTVGAVTSQSDQIRTIERYKASREAADLVISPDLAGFTMADFEKGPDLMERGYEAGEMMRPEIRRLSETLKTGGSQAIQRPPADKFVRISQINITSTGSVKAENALRNEIREALGEDSDLKKIRDILYSLYDRGDYTHVWYRLQPNGTGAYTLYVDAPEVILPRENFSFALDFSSQAIESRITEFSLKTSYQRWLAEEKDSQAYLELWLSDFPSLLLGIEHILPDRKLAVGADGYFMSQSHYFFDDDTVSSLYGLQILGGSLFLQIPVFNSLDLKGSFYSDFFWMDHQLGDDFLDDETWQRHGLKGRLSIDTLDRKIVPRSGLNAVALIDSSLNKKIENVSFFKIAGLLYIPFSHSFVMVPRWEAQGLLKGELSPLEMPVLGKTIKMYGYYPQELKDDNAAMAGLEFRVKVGNLPLGLGNDIYVAAGFNYAGLWENDVLEKYKDLQQFYGYGAGIILSTTLGEVKFSISSNEEGRISSFFGISASASLSDMF